MTHQDTVDFGFTVSVMLMGGGEADLYLAFPLFLDSHLVLSASETFCTKELGEETNSFKLAL